MCEDFALNLGQKRKLAHSSRKCPVSDLLSSAGNYFSKGNMSVVLHPICSTDFAPCYFSLFSPIEDADILTQFRRSRQNCQRCRTSSQNTTSKMDLKMTSAGTLHMCERIGFEHDYGQ
jgi:hypothetical protein